MRTALAPLNATIWRGVFAEPQSEAAQRLEELIARRREVRARSVETRVAREAAERALVSARDAERSAKAEHAALGGPADDLKSAGKTVANAVKALERARERDQAAQDAVTFLEAEVSRLVNDNLEVLFGELNVNAERSLLLARQGVANALAALEECKTEALRLETLIGAAADPAVRQLRGPCEQVSAAVKEMSRVARNLPAHAGVYARPVSSAPDVFETAAA